MMPPRDGMPRVSIKKQGRRRAGCVCMLKRAGISVNTNGHKKTRTQVLPLSWHAWEGTLTIVKPREQ